MEGVCIIYDCVVELNKSKGDEHLLECSLYHCVVTSNFVPVMLLCSLKFVHVVW